MKTKSLKKLGLLVAVAAVSVGTTLLTQHFSKEKETKTITMLSDTVSIPKSYAKFASVSSGVETDFTVAAELSVNAVVHVKTMYPARRTTQSLDPFYEFFFGRPQTPQGQNAPQQQGSGSGVIISPDGYIVTNNHVIENSTEIEIVLNDKRTFKAELVGTDPTTDIALLKIKAKNLPIIIMGNSDNLKVGEWVLAVGNPFNLTSTVTAGIVSAKARNINILDSSMKIESFIQTDAAVNPGNSGGALVNTHGELIGINTAIASQTGSYAGYSFAVPTSIVAKVVADLKQYGTVQRAVLGVGIAEISQEYADEHDVKSLNGVLILHVEDMSAAAFAGIEVDDIVHKINGVEVQNPSELQEQIARYTPGDKISVEIERKGKTMLLDVELKNRMGTTEIISGDNDLTGLGATFGEVPEKLKKQLGLRYGIQVKSLKTNGLMKSAGVQNDFIIVKVNNAPIGSTDELEEIYQTARTSNRQEQVLFVAGVYPNGKVAYYAINLAE